MNTYSTQHYGAGRKDCDKCGGLGYYQYDVPQDDPRFGKVFTCECQEDKSEEAVKRTAQLAGVTKEGWKLESDFWSLDGRQDLEEAIKAKAEQIIAGDVSGWLTLVSPYGLGKSAMGEWLVIQAIRAGVRSLFLTAKDAQDALKAGFDGYDVLWHRVETSALLVFDQPDWLYDKGSTYQINQVRNMLDERYRQRDHKATVILVNIVGWEKRSESGLSAIFNRAEEGKVVVAKTDGIRSAIGEIIEPRSVHHGAR